MMKIKSRKNAIVAFAVIAVALAITASMLVYPTFAAESEIQEKYVFVRARGAAFQRIDDETIKQYNAELNLTLDLGERRGALVHVSGVNGSLNVNGEIYTIKSGKGLILTKRHVALIHCVGVDENGTEVTLGIHSAYFWWGGSLYAFRAKALLRTADKPMLLLLRGAARAY